MKFWAIVFAGLCLASTVIGKNYHKGHVQPKIIKVIQPVEIVKIVKHIPPPKPVVKYVKLFHSTSVGHGHGFGHY